VGLVASVFSRVRAVSQRLRRSQTELDTCGWYRAAHPDTQGSPAASKKYSPPQLRKLNPEQAKLILIGHAMAGDEGAKELMGLVFPEPGKQVPRVSNEKGA
jgi:hypothetical protein